ncbi:MAG: hypothetical protein WC516_06450 [Patescibacteria group bacterium]|jgi:hypothetical protein
MKYIFKQPVEKYSLTVPVLVKSKSLKHKSEISPWKAHREFEEYINKLVSDKLLKLFLSIRKKWLKVDGKKRVFQKAIETIFKLNGKIYINPQTGQPLTNAQWEQVKKSLGSALQKIFRGHEDWFIKRAMLLGKVLQGMSFEQRQQASLEDITIPASIPGNKTWKNAAMFAQQHAGEYITKLTENAKTNISTTIINAISHENTSNQLEQDLFDDFADINRDWRRISETETATGVNNGMLLAELEDKVEGETVFMIGVTAGNACKYCLELIDNQVVVLTDGPVSGGFITVKGVEYPAIWPGKNNIGKKPGDYWVCGTLHPFCRCQFTRYYPEMEFLMKRNKKDEKSNS